MAQSWPWGSQIVVKNRGIQKLTLHFFLMGFTPCKAEQPLIRSAKRLRHAGKNLQLKDVCEF